MCAAARGDGSLGAVEGAREDLGVGDGHPVAHADDPGAGQQVGGEIGQLGDALMRTVVVCDGLLCGDLGHLRILGR